MKDARSIYTAREADKRHLSALFARGDSAGSIVFALAELRRGVRGVRAVRIAREREKREGAQ